ncbi:MAG: hypothetical protein KDA66_07870 [Planctomycetaceae bacterium]|nr:hypothetical protein [Planctomycetaceae bacterium]
MVTFAEILDAADKLTPDEQESLVEILKRRIAESNRAHIAREVAEARAEHQQSPAEPSSVADIMDEIRNAP